jgi:hypothetical protein
MVNNEPLFRTEELVRDDKGSNGIITGSAPSVSDDMRIPFGQPGELRGVKPGIHTSQNRKLPLGRKRQLALLFKSRDIVAIGF